MKLLTINSSGCGAPSNIAFYWLPQGYIHMAWIPPSSPSACSTGRVAAVGGEAWAGSWWEALSTGALVKHGSISWTKPDPSYCCVVGPGFGSAGQARVIFKKSLFFPPASDIYKTHYFIIFFRNVLLFPYVCELGSSRSPERSASAIVFL